ADRRGPPRDPRTPQGTEQAVALPVDEVGERPHHLTGGPALVSACAPAHVLHDRHGSRHPRGDRRPASDHTPLSITGQRYARPSLDALRPAMQITCDEIEKRLQGD